MPKRKAPAEKNDAVAAEETKEPETKADEAPEKPAASEAPKKRGRPPLSDEAKAKREEQKAKSAGRGRGRPKGSTKKSPKKK